MTRGRPSASCERYATPPAASSSPLAAQVLHQRDGIDGLLLFAELNHAFENVPVLRKEEILGAQALDGGVQRVIIEQNRAQNAAFGFDIVRQRSFDG